MIDPSDLTHCREAIRTGSLSFHADAQSGNNWSKEVASIQASLSGPTSRDRGGALRLQRSIGACSFLFGPQARW